jgi:hypothetical protein
MYWYRLQIKWEIKKKKKGRKISLNVRKCRNKGNIALVYIKGKNANSRLLSCIKTQEWGRVLQSATRIFIFLIGVTTTQPV